MPCKTIFQQTHTIVHEETRLLFQKDEQNCFLCCVTERFLPSGGAGLEWIFLFLPKSDMDGALSLSKIDLLTVEAWLSLSEQSVDVEAWQLVLVLVLSLLW